MPYVIRLIQICKKSKHYYKKNMLFFSTEIDAVIEVLIAK